MCRPLSQAATGIKREEAKATVDEKDAVQSRADESPASSASLTAASLIGSDVRCKAGRGRAEAWEAKFPERDASVPRRRCEPARRLLDGDAEPRAGRPHVEPTDVYSCPPQEGGYSPRGASYR